MKYNYEGKSATKKNYSTFKVVFSSHVCTGVSDDLGITHASQSW